jgi:hypothetical protein
MARNYHQGIFYPTNPHKYVGDPTKIVFRSSWENKAFVWADTNPQVLNWASEEKIVPYISPVDGKFHKYYVDLLLRVKDNAGNIKKYMVEIKPHAQTLPPKQTKNKKRLLEETMTYAVNTAKWKAAEAWCAKNGFEFIILTEHHLKV